MILIVVVILIIIKLIIDYLIAILAFNPVSIATYTVKDIDYLYDGIAIKIIKKSDKVILFNHNNADDIGICNGYCEWLSNITECSVIFYDYIGYGLSYKGKLSENNLLKSADIVYRFVREVLNINNIYIIGKSLGTIPATYLSQYDNEGLILISPLASGVRLYYNNLEVLDYLCFPTIQRIKNTKNKIGIIHGTVDKLINVSHAYQLISTIKKYCPQNYYKPLIVNAGHNNIERKHTILFVNYLREFIGYL